MARSQARIHCSVWSDESDFRQLPGAAQRLYFLLISQATMTLTGVVALTTRRFADMAIDTPPSAIKKALAVLEESRFISTDWATEEILVRSFVRGDGVWASPKTRGACIAQIGAISSPKLRKAALSEMIRAENDRLADGGKRDDTLKRLDTLSDTLSDTPSDTPRARARADSDSDSDSDIAPLPSANGKRVSDHLFDSVTAECGINPEVLTDSGRGSLNRALKELRMVGVDPLEIPSRAARYRALYAGVSLTPSALAKHWASLGPLAILPRREERPRCDNPECGGGWVLTPNGDSRKCPQCNPRTGISTGRN